MKGEEDLDQIFSFLFSSFFSLCKITLLLLGKEMNSFVEKQKQTKNTPFLPCALVGSVLTASELILGFCAEVYYS